MIKKIFIGPYSIGFLSSFQDIEQIPLFKIYTPDIRFNTFFYSSLMQTGANLIEIIEDPARLLSGSKTIKQRVLEGDKKDYEKIRDSTNKIFLRFTRKHKSNKKLIDTLKNTEIFINDLLYSARKGSDFLFLGNIPDLEQYKTILQPELYYPLHNLFSYIDTDNLFVPSPISVIPTSEAKKFDSIIKSDIYFEYSESHQMLSVSNIQRVANSIRIGSEKLIASNPMLLSIYNNFTSLIPLSRLIDPKVGEFSKIASNTLTKLSDFKNRQNIVIYRYKDVAFHHLEIQLDRSIERLADDFIKWTKEGIKKAIDEKIDKKQVFPYIKNYITRKKDEKMGKL